MKVNPEEKVDIVDLTPGEVEDSSDEDNEDEMDTTLYGEMKGIASGEIKGYGRSVNEAGIKRSRSIESAKLVLERPEFAMMIAEPKSYEDAIRSEEKRKWKEAHMT